MGRSLVGYRPGGPKESDTAEGLSTRGHQGAVCDGAQDGLRRLVGSVSGLGSGWTCPPGSKQAEMALGWWYLLELTLTWALKDQGRRAFVRKGIPGAGAGAALPGPGEVSPAEGAASAEAWRQAGGPRACSGARSPAGSQPVVAGAAGVTPGKQQQERGGRDLI